MAHNTARTSSAECHIVNGQASLSCLTQRNTPPSDRFSISGNQISSVSGIPHRHLVNNCNASRVWPAADDNIIQFRTDVVRQLEGVQTRQSSATTSQCVTAVRPSPRTEFGRRRRPVSAMESTSRMPPPPPPPPPARKPQLPDHLRSQLDRGRTNDAALNTGPRNSLSDHQFHQLTLPQMDEDVVLSDLHQQNPARNFVSEFTHDYNSVTMRSSKTFVPATHSTDVTTMNCDRSTCNSVLITAGAPPVNRPNCVFVDVGSCAQQLNHLKTFYERPRDDLRPDAAVNSTLCTGTAAETDICPCDATDGITTPSEPCLHQQDFVSTRVPPSTTAPVSEIGVLAKFNASLTVENDESAVSDEILLLPPPPEFDDSFAVPAPSCSTVPASRAYNSARDSVTSVDGWSVDEVCNWLDAVSLSKHCASFRLGNINGASLRTLGRSEFISLGLTDVHDRMEFERALRKLLNNCSLF